MQQMPSWLVKTLQVVVPFILGMTLVLATLYQLDQGDWIFWQGTTNKLMVAVVSAIMAYYTLVILDEINGRKFTDDQSAMQTSVGPAIYRGLRFFAVCYLYATIMG